MSFKMYLILQKKFFLTVDLDLSHPDGKGQYQTSYLTRSRPIAHRSSPHVLNRK